MQATPPTPLRAGRLTIELFTEAAPRACENFRCLCTGERGKGKSSGKPLHFKGTKFHRIVKGFVCQGGDIVKGRIDVTPSFLVFLVCSGTDGAARMVSLSLPAGAHSLHSPPLRRRLRWGQHLWQALQRREGGPQAQARCSGHRIHGEQRVGGVLMGFRAMEVPSSFLTPVLIAAHLFKNPNTLPWCAGRTATPPSSFLR